MTEYTPSICRSCAHLRPNGVTCDAYPDRIPEAFLFRAGDHRTPAEGDHGITWTLAPDRSDDYLDWLLFAQTGPIAG